VRGIPGVVADRGARAARDGRRPERRRCRWDSRHARRRERIDRGFAARRDPSPSPHRGKRSRPPARIAAGQRAGDAVAAGSFFEPPSPSCVLLLLRSNRCLLHTAGRDRGPCAHRRRSKSWRRRGRRKLLRASFSFLCAAPPPIKLSRGTDSCALFLFSLYSCIDS
jgi:hypothetical protein